MKKQPVSKITIVRSKAIAARANVSTGMVGYDLAPPNQHYLSNYSISFLIIQNLKEQRCPDIYRPAEHLVFKDKLPVMKCLSMNIVTRKNLIYFPDKTELSPVNA